jgi:small subunit ribosomal protein S21
MIQVTKKDSRESTDGLLRRFNRKVQQSGIINEAKRIQYFEKPISKRERREKAILRRQRKVQKIKKLRLL